MLAAMRAEEIAGDTVATALAEDPDSAAYAPGLGQLVALRATAPRIAPVYTFVQQHGTVRVIVNAHAGLTGGSAYLDAYSNMPLQS